MTKNRANHDSRDAARGRRVKVWRLEAVTAGIERLVICSPIECPRTEGVAQLVRGGAYALIRQCGANVAGFVSPSANACSIRLALDPQ